MKKSLIALAVMAAAGAASAQSSVTLFGIVDVALTYGRASGDGSNNLTMTSSGYNSSRLGFRGTEDLGGGMAASFWLEGQLFPDDGGAGTARSTNNANVVAAGGLNFARRSTVSLSGGWGEVRLGRDYTPSFWNLTLFDPFGTVGVGASATTGVYALAPAGTAGVAIRASNSIGYFLPPKLGGFYGQVGVWLNDTPNTGAANEDDGQGAGLRVGYGAGPFNVAFGLARTEFNTGDFRTWNIGGHWDFGMAKLMGQITRDEVEGPTNIEGRGFLLGALVPVGAGEIRVAYSTYRTDLNLAGVADPRVRKLALGYVHNLSKRTALYATAAVVRNRNGANVTVGGATLGTTGNRTTGIDLGVRHSF